MEYWRGGGSDTTDIDCNLYCECDDRSDIVSVSVSDCDNDRTCFDNFSTFILVCSIVCFVY